MDERFIRIDERFETVFKKFDEVIQILREREQRLPNLVYSVGGMVIGGVVIWMLTK